MMDAEREELSGPRILEELNPGLRDAVEQVLRDPMPRDLTRIALERTQRALSLRERRRVEFASDRLTAAVQHNRRRLVVWALLAACASIGLIAVGMHFRAGDTESRQIGIMAPQPSTRSNQPEASDGGPPTAWAYTQAARQSPEALDALLDRQVIQSFSADRSFSPDEASIWAIRRTL